MSANFRVGITADFLRADGSLGFGDIGLAMLDSESRVAYEFLPAGGAEISAAVADQYDALLVLAPRITSASLDGCRLDAGGSLRSWLRHRRR